MPQGKLIQRPTMVDRLGGAFGSALDAIRDRMSPQLRQAPIPQEDVLDSYAKRSNHAWNQGMAGWAQPPVAEAAEAMLPTPTPTNVPMRYAPATLDAISQGFSRFGGDVPISSAAKAFVQAGEELPDNIDPYLPAVISLMETGGGRHNVGDYNAFNISGTQNGKRGFVGYPDYETAILGGPNGDVESSGFVGLISEGSPYAKFRETGRLDDFFRSYTPPGEQYGNPSMEQLLDRYARIRRLFVE